MVFLPVRHHSPACARAVGEIITRLRPAAVLVEGPSDFNDRLEELFLPHRLPVAVYSWPQAQAAEDEAVPQTRGAWMTDAALVKPLSASMARRWRCAPSEAITFHQLLVVAPFQNSPQRKQMEICIF